MDSTSYVKNEKPCAHCLSDESKTVVPNLADVRHTLKVKHNVTSSEDVYSSNIILLIISLKITTTTET